MRERKRDREGETEVTRSKLMQWLNRRRPEDKKKTENCFMSAEKMRHHGTDRQRDTR